MTSMGFIGYNRRFMWAAVGASVSTHDSRLLRSCSNYSDVENGQILPNGSLNLHPYGEIPFTTVGDSTFPSYSWLLKAIQRGNNGP